MCASLLLSPRNWRSPDPSPLPKQTRDTMIAVFTRVQTSCPRTNTSTRWYSRHANTRSLRRGNAGSRKTHDLFSLCRRTSPTVPGELIRYPNLGLPLPPSSSEGSADDKTNTGEGSKGTARGGKTKAKSAAERAKGRLGSASSSATGREGTGGGGTGGTAFGDLVVRASVTLPGGEFARFEQHGHYYRGR